jgi:hypothetical protein
MKHFIVIVLSSVISLLWACKGNGNRPATNIQDSLNSLTPSSVATDPTGSQLSIDSASERTADSVASSAAAKTFGFSPDSASFVHMKDSMLAMAKDKLGKNAGMVDSMMSAVGKVSTSSSGGDSASNDAAPNRSIPYHEPLPPNYVIPVTGNGPGFYYEYVGGSVMDDKKSGLSFTILSDPSKTSGWNVHLDAYVQMQQLGVKSHYSFLMDNTFTHILMNDDHKVYTRQKAEETIQQKNYTVTDIKVTRIGKEKLHGFSCVHAKVASVTHFMAEAQRNEFDIWRSEEVPGAASLESSIQVLSAPFTLVMEDRLVKMGCRGAVVKIEFNQKSSVIRKELFRIDKQNIDASIFNIPAGYREDKNTSLYSLMPGN